MSGGLVVVTGAAGFVGHALCAHLAGSGRAYRAIVRDATAPGAHGLPAVAAGDLATATEEQLAMIVDGATAVVHLAGRAHIMRERLTDAPKRYDAANVLATGRLAAAAARAGVGHFVFASTVKIHGESTRPGRPFRAADPWAPQDVYARSKAKAERALTAACAGTAMVPLVLRLPLVYGPGVKGNFLSLMDAVARRALLPLGAIDNRRDLLYVGNLVHAIATLLASSEALGGAWLIADGEAMSTPMLARRIGAALRITPRLLSIPVPLLSLAARLTGRGSPLRRLTQSLEVDAAPWRERVGSAPFTVDEGLAETARWWRLRHAI